MFRKLFLAYFGVVVVTLAVFGFISGKATRDRILEEVALRLGSETGMLRPFVRLHAPGRPLQDAVTEIGRQIGSRLTVIGPDGTVLADSEGDPSRMDNHNSRPEILEARAKGRGSHVRHSETVRVDMMYFAALLDPMRPEGPVVRAALPLARVRSELGSLYRSLGVTFLVIALAGAGLAFLIARWMTRPLRQLEDAALWIAAGDFSRKAPAGAGEFGSVGRAMNRMADELSARLERLKAESSKLEAVISGMQEGVAAVDPNGRIVHANAAGRTLLGLTGDLAGYKLWEVARIPALEEIVSRVIREDAVVHSSLEVGPRTVALSVSPVRAGGGAVVVARDVTEDRRYDSLRREFVANVSHELRTPITLIRGALETLMEGAWKDEAHAPEFLQMAQNHAGRLSRLVEDLLELSRLESGGDVVRPRQVHPDTILERIRETFAPLAEKKKQRLSIESAAPEDLEADPDLLERALSNLVDNAVKYTPEGGRITVEARGESDHTAFVVRDSGPGIPEIHLPRVFERFYRVEKSRSRELGGTGLGLAIVKHIAQLHGGSVTVQSKPGAGTAFTLRIPRRGRE